MHDSREPLTPAALYRAVLLAFALVLVILIFPVMASLVLVLILVVVVAVPLSAATDRFERARVPRAVAAPLLMLAAIAVIGGLIALVVPIFIDEGRTLVHSLPTIYQDVRRSLHLGGSKSSSGHGIQTYIRGYTDHPQKLLGPASTVGAGIAGVVTTLVVIIITSLYTAVRPEPLQDGVARLVTPPRRDQARHVMHRLAESYKGWLRGLAVGMVVLWVITYVGLLLIGLPYAVVFATLTAVAMVIPYYGALLSAIPPILVALTISPTKALLVAALYLGAHFVEGNVTTPLVMARTVELHPALVAAGVIAVERAFGAAGLIVAVPILVTLKILTEELWVQRIEARYGDARPLPDEEDGASPQAHRPALQRARTRP